MRSYQFPELRCGLIRNFLVFVLINPLIFHKPLETKKCSVVITQIRNSLSWKVIRLNFYVGNFALKIKMKTFRIFLLCVLITPSAWAYVDPGSGMLLWQGLVALIGAILIFFRNPVQVIKSWIDRLRGK
jgi:hypothetical protein